MKTAQAKAFMYWGSTDNGSPISLDAGETVELEPTGEQRTWIDGRKYDDYLVYRDGEYMGRALEHQFIFSV